MDAFVVRSKQKTEMVETDSKDVKLSSEPDQGRWTPLGMDGPTKKRRLSLDLPESPSEQKPKMSEQAAPNLKTSDGGNSNVVNNTDAANSDCDSDNVVVDEPKKAVCPFDEMLIQYAQSNMNIDSCNIESTIPEICKRQSCWLGIDEAGRGPVCGPMTYGAAFGPILNDTHESGKLKSMGFADSKQLTEQVREKLFKDIKKSTDYLGWIVSILSPADISQAMLGRTNYNLNALSHDTAINMIQKVLKAGVELTEIYVDTVGKEDVYQAKLQSIFPQLKVTVTSKADDKFPICSAASICAKVSRDRIVERWRYCETIPNTSLEVGSGYPSDPACKKWLNNSVDPIFGYPSIVRFSWSTAKKIMDERCASVKWEDDSDDEGDTPSVMSFFGKDANKTNRKERPRHKFFKDAKLKHVTAF